MSPAASNRSTLDEEGFLVVGRLLADAMCDTIAATLAASSHPAGARAATASANRRHLLRDVPLVAQVARAPEIVSWLGSLHSSAVFPVRALLFDKTPDANWSVGWHQDVTIAVRTRVDVDGFTGWSVKDGVPHVEYAAAPLPGGLEWSERA